jgi:hypothetical protein
MGPHLTSWMKVQSQWMKVQSQWMKVQSQWMKVQSQWMEVQREGPAPPEATGNRLIVRGYSTVRFALGRIPTSRALRRNSGP